MAKYVAGDLPLGALGYDPGMSLMQLPEPSTELGLEVAFGHCIRYLELVHTLCCIQGMARQFFLWESIRGPGLALIFFKKIKLVLFLECKLGFLSTTVFLFELDILPNSKHRTRYSVFTKLGEHHKRDLFEKI